MNLDEVDIVVYSCGSGKFNSNSPAVRIIHKASGKHVQCHLYRTKRKNIDFCMALLWLFVKHGIEPIEVRHVIDRYGHTMYKYNDGKDR